MMWVLLMSLRVTERKKQIPIDEEGREREVEGTEIQGGKIRGNRWRERGWKVELLCHWIPFPAWLQPFNSY